MSPLWTQIQRQLSHFENYILKNNSIMYNFVLIEWKFVMQLNWEKET
jgi:hypothetical protein